MRNLDAGRARQFVWWQVLATVLLSALCLPGGTIVAGSALIGGLTAILGNVVVTAAVFGAYRADEAQQLGLRIYVAGLVRLMLVIAVFVATFWLFKAVHIAALLGVYLAVHMLPIVMASRNGAG